MCNKKNVKFDFTVSDSLHIGKRHKVDISKNEPRFFFIWIVLYCWWWIWIRNSLEQKVEYPVGLIFPFNTSRLITKLSFFIPCFLWFVGVFFLTLLSFFLRTTGSLSNTLDTKKSWVMEINVGLNEMPLPCWDNREYM